MAPPKQTESESDSAAALLAARAAELARPEVPAAEPGAGFLAVTFTLAAEQYACDCAYVREVRQYTDLAPLPSAPASVLGILNLRGQILSVLDLRAVLGLPQPPLTSASRTLILESEAMIFGVVADAVVGTRVVELAALEPAPPTLPPLGARYVRGVTEDRLIVLDVARILSDPDLIVDQRRADPRADELGELA